MTKMIMLLLLMLMMMMSCCAPPPQKHTLSLLLRSQTFLPSWPRGTLSLTLSSTIHSFLSRTLSLSVISVYLTSRPSMIVVTSQGALDSQLLPSECSGNGVTWKSFHSDRSPSQDPDADNTASWTVGGTPREPEAKHFRSSEKIRLWVWGLNLGAFKGFADPKKGCWA